VFACSTCTLRHVLVDPGNSPHPVRGVFYRLKIHRHPHTHTHHTHAYIHSKDTTAYYFSTRTEPKNNQQSPSHPPASPPFEQMFRSLPSPQRIVRLQQQINTKNKTSQPAGNKKIRGRQQQLRLVVCCSTPQQSTDLRYITPLTRRFLQQVVVEPSTHDRGQSINAQQL
jgi:hypothetical protein